MLSDVLITYSEFCKVNALSLQCGLLLVCVYDNWNRSGCGINCNEAMMLLGYNRGNYMGIYDKFEIMLGLGLIEVVGTGRKHSRLFGPTDYGCAIIEEGFASLKDSDNKSAD